MKKVLSLFMVTALCLTLIPALASEEPEAAVSGEAALVPVTEESEPVEAPEVVPPELPEEISETAPAADGANYACSGSCGDHLTWTYDGNGTLTISGTGAMWNWDTPSSMPWYDVNFYIFTIIVKSGVTSIGDRAFQGCSRCTSVKIPSGVTSLGSQSFASCRELETIELPDSVTSIGDSAFSYCAKLEKFNIPANVTELGESVFLSCIALTSVTFPVGITEIKHHMFNGCSGLTTMKIPDGITVIGESVFSYCENLTSVKLPGSLELIDIGAFRKTGLETVYYAGSAADWSGVNVKTGNDELKNAQFVYGWEDGLGDADGDGSVTAADLVIVAKYISGEIKTISAKTTDLDKNNRVDLIDLVKIMKLCAI